MTYNSIAVLAFTVEHDTEDPYDSINNNRSKLQLINHIRRRLLSRMADLDDNDEWFAALDFDDTQEGPLND